MGPFVRSAFSLQLKRRHYNDDARLGPYNEGKLHLDGRGEFANPWIDFAIERAKSDAIRRRHFLFPTRRHAPSGTLDVIEFIRSADKDRVVKIRGVQLRATEGLARCCALAQTIWNARIPWSIAAADGNLQTVAGKHPAHHLNVGGSAWASQFAYGFPVVGSLSPKCSFPRDDKLGVRLPAHEISDSAPAQVRGRVTKYGRKNDPMRRIEAMGQVKDGWLLSPYSVIW